MSVGGHIPKANAPVLPGIIPSNSGMARIDDCLAETEYGFLSLLDSPLPE
jgi:hypothetical protein